MRLKCLNIFFDMEKEKQEILNILRTKPQLINFIYEHINSEKIDLITHLIEFVKTILYFTRI